MTYNASYGPTGFTDSETNDEEFGGKFLPAIMVQVLWETYQMSESQDTNACRDKRDNL